MGKLNTDMSEYNEVIMDRLRLYEPKVDARSYVDEVVSESFQKLNHQMRSKNAVIEKSISDLIQHSLTAPEFIGGEDDCPYNSVIDYL